MERAVELARQARGHTAPNPPVGAVIVRDGDILGEGFTQPAGGAHAEIVALQAAGEAIGSTLYVTLEPCTYWGRTPPCTDAILAAGIRDAHVSVIDPNPRVNGSGVRLLEQHGIHVTIGECEVEALDLIESHAKFVTTGQPFVTLLLNPPEAIARIQRVWSEFTLDEHSLPRNGAVDLQAFLAALRTPSCLVDASSPLAEKLLAAGFVDKIIAGTHQPSPPGFAVRQETVIPPYKVLYPDVHRNR